MTREGTVGRDRTESTLGNGCFFYPSDREAVYGKRRIGKGIEALDHKCVPNDRSLGHPLTVVLFYSGVAGLGRVGRTG